MALNATANINTYLEQATNAGAGVINPEVFYSKQLLDTIRLDADQYIYYRYADSQPIQEKADKLMVRRWAPLQAHTVPLVEGTPPKSDKGSVEKYEIAALQYGRYMEFTDQVDFKIVDPVIAHYTKEYSLVAMETLDLLAREVLLTSAQKWYAGGLTVFDDLTVASVPTMTDLRLIIMALKKALVKPRSNGRFHVIGSAEFFYDMISDPVVEKYMTFNNTTKSMYDDGRLIPMFEMEFYETMAVPASADFIKDAKQTKMLYRYNTSTEAYEYNSIDEETLLTDGVTTVATAATAGYVADGRTGQDASYIEVHDDELVWDLDTWNTENDDTFGTWVEFKAQHILILGKDALVRTELTGEGQTRMFVKPLGSAGVLDPIDQRQSIGFKINSVGFGSTRLEAIVDYICVPTQLNVL